MLFKTVAVASLAAQALAQALGPALAQADVTVGGYVETYYQLNLRSPSNRTTNLRGFDHRDRTFTLSNVAVDVTGERGPLTTRVILQVGATPTIYYAAEPAAGAEQWKYLQQATLSYVASHELVFEAGLVPSPIGPEVFAIKDNLNWSRSNLFFALPSYHTGARVSKPLGSGWTGTLAVYTGWNSVVDNNRYPSVAASAAYSGDRVTGQLLYFGGIERPTGAPEGKAWRHLVDALAMVTLTDEASIGGQANAGVESNELGTSSWVAAAGYGKLAVTETVYVAGRADYFLEQVADGASAIFWPTGWIASGTATLAVQPVDGLSVRLEYRHDQAEGDVFFGGTVDGDGTTTPYVPNRRAQDTITLGATAWF